MILVAPTSAAILFIAKAERATIRPPKPSAQAILHQSDDGEKHQCRDRRRNYRKWVGGFGYRRGYNNDADARLVRRRMEVFQVVVGAGHALKLSGATSGLTGSEE